MCNQSHEQSKVYIILQFSTFSRMKMYNNDVIEKFNIAYVVILNLSLNSRNLIDIRVIFSFKNAT